MARCSRSKPRALTFTKTTDAEQRGDHRADQRCEREGERRGQPHRRRSRHHGARRDRAFAEDRLRRRDRDDGNARHAAQRHLRAVRAAARGERAAAGSARRRDREPQHDRDARCRAASREFVNTMNDIGERSGAVERPLRGADEVVPRRHHETCARHHGRADKFDAQGKALAAAAQQIDSEQPAHRGGARRPPRGARFRRQPDRQQGRRPRHRLKRFSRCCRRRSRPPKAARATSRASSPNPRPKAPRRSPTSTSWCARPPTRSASAPPRRCTRSTSRRPARPPRCSARPASASSRSCAR